MRGMMRKFASQFVVRTGKASEVATCVLNAFSRRSFGHSDLAVANWLQNSAEQAQLFATETPILLPYHRDTARSPWNHGCLRNPTTPFRTICAAKRSAAKGLLAGFNRCGAQVFSENAMDRIVYRQRVANKLKSAVPFSSGSCSTATRKPCFASSCFTSSNPPASS